MLIFLSIDGEWGGISWQLDWPRMARLTLGYLAITAYRGSEGRLLQSAMDTIPLVRQAEAQGVDLRDPDTQARVVRILQVMHDTAARTHQL